MSRESLTEFALKCMPGAEVFRRGKKYNSVYWHTRCLRIFDHTTISETREQCIRILLSVRRNVVPPFSLSRWLWLLKQDIRFRLKQKAYGLQKFIGVVADRI